MTYFLQIFAVVVVGIGCVKFAQAVKEALKDDDGYHDDHTFFEDDEDLS